MTSRHHATYEGKDLEAMCSARNYGRWVIGECRPFLRGAVAEIGAGSGTFSTLVRETGVERLVAMEPSPEMYAILEQRLGKKKNVELVHSYLEDAFTSYRGRFDAVCYFNVLEHIKRPDVHLLPARAILKDGGHLCLFVPALSLLYSDFDRAIGHYRRYHKSQLKRIVGDAGFEILKVRYFDILGILPWLVTFVLMKGTLSRRKVLLYDRLVVPVARLLESLLPLPVGKNLLLVARKN